MLQHHQVGHSYFAGRWVSDVSVYGSKYLFSQWNRTLRGHLRRVIYTETLKVIAEASCPGDPVRVFHDAKPNHLMTINYGSKSIGVFDDETLAVVDRIELTRAPIALSFDIVLDRAFLSVDDNKLHVVDLDTLEILKNPDV